MHSYIKAGPSSSHPSLSKAVLIGYSPLKDCFCRKLLITPRYQGRARHVFSSVSVTSPTSCKASADQNSSQKATVDTNEATYDLLHIEELQEAARNASEGPADTASPEEPSSSDSDGTSIADRGSGVLHVWLNSIAKLWARVVCLAQELSQSLSRTLLWLPALARRRKLQRLQTSLKGDPLSSSKRAVYAKALSEDKKFSEVIKLWNESREPGMVNSSFAVEYIHALVNTGQMKEFADSNTQRTSPTPTLLDFLSDCQQRLDVSQAKPAGNSALQPLHVVMQNSAPQEQSKFWATRVLQTIVSLIVVPTMWLLFLIAGWLAIKSSLPNNTVAAAPGTSMAGPTSTSSVFAPKEYNKDAVPEKSKKTFADVRGCDEAKAEVTEIVEFLKQPDKFTRLGGKLPKGVLLTGPPGTGKTLLAKAIAGEAGVPFFFRSGSEFDEMLVGVGSLRVRTLFAAAKKAAPCIVFIDEIDAIGQARTNSLEGGSAKTLNQLLVEMDGFETNEGVVVIAATNLEKKLDAALTRPGRFDREVAVPLPDVRGRLDIIEYYLKGKPLAQDVDAQTLARRTPGFSGADLSNLINEAALNAGKNNKDSISSIILDEARDKILMGSPRNSMVQTAEARRLTAFHEAGHALVALNTKGATPIHKATIVPRGHALGMVSMVPHQDEYSITLQQMRAGIDVSMGGRVAEELIFGTEHVTSGATSDLKHATQQARHMVMECGMSNEIGPVYISEDRSSETRRIIDAEVTKILREAYDRVTAMLISRRNELETLAKALLEHETLTADEIKQALVGTLQKELIAKSEAQSDVDALLGHGLDAEKVQHNGALQ